MDKETKDTKLCPFRKMPGVVENSLYVEFFPCLEDKCQMWRETARVDFANGVWKNKKTGEEAPKDSVSVSLLEYEWVKTAPEKTVMVGYCGLAGKP